MPLRENKLRPSKQRLRWLTKEEEAKLLSNLSGDTCDLVVLLLSTGARYGEVAKLEWSSIDLETREIHLYRSKVKNESVIPMSRETWGQVLPFASRGPRRAKRRDLTLTARSRRGHGAAVAAGPVVHPIPERGPVAISDRQCGCGRWW